MRGFRLTATDVSWAAGEGTDIRAPIATLLLVLTGRYTVLQGLTGPGAADLVARSPAGPGPLIGLRRRAARSSSTTR
ncbi:hypothetical protein [Actinomadura sp. 3N407]|uniref:hypothetical protein n=1 Tax=Actinomadura sp. 3N407 TaxID=3457423 RepID=UPI003FCD906A